jgi:hypothetical protein
LLDWHCLLIADRGAVIGALIYEHLILEGGDPDAVRQHAGS